ncbi:MAG: phytanoyl-CoA dioxygenase family protein [Sphingomonadales bacterium]|nr:phytanoyl-CoA dioxygenase family protein [Sphingomonadales bacterium]
MLPQLADQIEAFQRDGAVLLKNVLDQPELALLRTGVEEAHERPSPRYSRVQSADGRGETTVDQFPSLASPALKALIEGGKVAEIAARMMRAPSAQLVLDQLFYKAAGRVVPTPWHQDTPFLCVRGPDIARVWLSCDPSPADLTVQVVRGSHRWNVVFDTRGEADSDVTTSEEGGAFSYEGIGDARLPPTPDIERYRASFDILTFEVEPGDAVVFHGNILHGAAGRDDYALPRRAFATMWGGPELRCHRPGGFAMPTVGQLTGDHRAPHGARIGDHPEEFPFYWRDAAA